MILSQNHIAINVSDRDNAVKFYRDALGFEIVSEIVREDRGDIMIFMWAHGIMLEIFADKGCPARLTEPEALGLRHLCFTVTDIEKEWERINALGCSPEPIKLHPGTDKRLFFFKDPDGLPIEFHE